MTTPNMVEVAALIGDPSRAEMLVSLLGGKSLPASELARAAHVTPQTASSHLAKMVGAGLLVQTSYGRHRYYRLANAEVAHALEALNAIAPSKPVRSLRASDQAKALHFARTCYDHIAGEVGVAITDRLLEMKVLREDERDFRVTAEGANWFVDFGIDIAAMPSGRRHFARQCLDWSERRHHMSGVLGAALTQRLFDLGWVTRIPGGRAIRVSQDGFEGLADTFGITFEQAIPTATN